MLASFPAAFLVSTVLGFLSGLGIGGGSLLLLWLTVILGFDPATARCINLLFFLPSALVSLYFRVKQGTVRLTNLLPAIAAGCCGAIAGALLSVNLDLQVLKKLFGIVLILSGMRELTYRPKKFR